MRRLLGYTPGAGEYISCENSGKIYLHLLKYPPSTVSPTVADPSPPSSKELPVDVEE